MLELKNHFDISGNIEIRGVDIARVACIYKFLIEKIGNLAMWFPTVLISIQD